MLSTMEEGGREGGRERKAKGCGESCFPLPSHPRTPVQSTVCIEVDPAFLTAKNQSAWSHRVQANPPHMDLVHESWG